MSVPVTPARTMRAALARADAPLVGMWLSTGSPIVAEICAGGAMDLLFIDGEHGPNDLVTVLHQLQVLDGYDVTTIVRLPSGDPVLIKQFLEIGAGTVLVPMIDTAADAAAVVSASRYTPDGIRGMGSALGRSSRWRRVTDYVARANEHVSVVVQVESAVGLSNATEIAAVPGVDAILIGPADLAASLGITAGQGDPGLIATVTDAIATIAATGIRVGVNAFDPQVARRYLDAGASFVIAGADVTLLVEGSDRLAGVAGAPR